MMWLNIAVSCSGRENVVTGDASGARRMEGVAQVMVRRSSIRVPQAQPDGWIRVRTACLTSDEIGL